MELCHPPSVRRAAAYKPASTRRIVLLGIVSVLYAIVGHFVYTTIGDPYRIAVAEFEVLKQKHPELYGPSSIATSNAEKAARRIGGKVNTRQRLFDEFEDDEEDDNDDDDDDDHEYDELETGEAADANATEEEDDFDPLDLEETPSMPPTFLPNAWAAAALFALVTSHALFHLMCHWSVDFKAMALFQPLSSKSEMAPGVSVLVEPHPHRGAKAICAVSRDVRSGSGRLFIIFQRQRYDYDPNFSGETKDGSDSAERNGGLSLMKCPDNLDLREYFATNGLDHATVLKNQAHFGLNSLAIAQPKFFELFKQQLVSPIAMFQFFTSLLWLMDEYWQYCLFSIFNVFTFESMTVFQRLKTMKTLDGMSTKSVPILAFRDGQWITTTTSDLVPGDVVSVCRSTQMGNAVVVNDTVPCDCLILRGSAVVNEATLTGESVPQMKDEASSDYTADKCNLDLDGVHRVHVLFSGTSLINATPTKQKQGTASSGGSQKSQNQRQVDRIPTPPNSGCLCYVLRTGFNSSQGELVQMIEFSTQKVSSNNRETFLALAILLLFALVAAGYVLKKGLEKGDQTTHQLLLKCVIIVTSVVPQQLPMQMALAVNTALMQLMKSGIFCTEPFRVPYAGKIQHCLFDKTGTLSTDKLIPIGIVNATDQIKSKPAPDEQVVKKLVSDRVLERVPSAAPGAAMILAACHSLVQVDAPTAKPAASTTSTPAITNKGPELIGDPVELAALQGISWEYDAKRQEARPAGQKAVKAKLAECEQALAAHAAKAPAATVRAVFLLRPVNAREYVAVIIDSFHSFVSGVAASALLFQLEAKETRSAT